MDFEQWYRELPKFTKYFMIGVVGAAVIISSFPSGFYKLALSWSGIVENYYVRLTEPNTHSS
jgi:hypothetical protein